MAGGVISPARSGTSGPFARGGFRLRWPDEAAADGYPGGFGAVVGAELGEDLADVELDGALGDEEPLGDLLVAQPPRDEPEHLDLPGRQRLGVAPVAPGAIEQSLRHGG